MAARALPDREARLRREVVTPEGVPVGVRLGDAGERFTAFAIDVAIIYGTTIVVTLLLVFAMAASGPASWATSFVLLSSFLLRNFYFIYFELSWQGATPGKRRLGLRVVDRRGGPLSTGAVLARNLMRDVEVFLPLSWLASAADTPGWASLAGVAWVAVLALMPLFNRDRMRVGDLVAGTIVVHLPRRTLLDDLSDGGAAAAPEHAFTEAQLSAYGIYELQVLERVLREDGGAAGRRGLDEVSLRIRQKIAWQGDAGDSRRFLQAFYAALREHLERRMLLGKRRADKHSAP